MPPSSYAGKYAGRAVLISWLKLGLDPLIGSCGIPSSVIESP